MSCSETGGAGRKRDVGVTSARQTGHGWWSGPRHVSPTRLHPAVTPKYPQVLTFLHGGVQLCHLDDQQVHPLLQRVHPHVEAVCFIEQLTEDVLRVPAWQRTTRARHGQGWQAGSPLPAPRPDRTSPRRLCGTLAPTIGFLGADPHPLPSTTGFLEAEPHPPPDLAQKEGSTNHPPFSCPVLWASFSVRVVPAGGTEPWQAVPQKLLGLTGSRRSQKTTIVHHDLWEPSPEGGKLRTGQRGERCTREKPQFVSLSQFFSCSASPCLALHYLLLSQVWAQCLAEHRWLQHPSRPSTHPVSAPQLLRVSSNPTYQTAPEIKALLISARLLTRLGHLYLISFSPGWGSHGLSTRGCCSHRLLPAAP